MGVKLPGVDAATGDTARDKSEGFLLGIGGAVALRRTCGLFVDDGGSNGVGTNVFDVRYGIFWKDCEDVFGTSRRGWVRGSRVASEACAEFD